MYAQLGTIRFEGLKGFTSLEETYGVSYAQHERINGKPRIQATGDALDTISFEMYLHADFTEPESDISAIETAMRGREVQRLILGNGRIVGNFVITNFTKSTLFTDNEGNIIEATLSVDLLEFFSEDMISDTEKEAKANAFATTARNNSVRSVLPPKLSPASVVTHDVAEIQASGITVNQYVGSVEKNPATAAYYSGKISAALDSMESNLQDIQGKLTEAEDLGENATSLPTAIDDVNTRIQNLKAVLPITDINQVKTLNKQLQGSIVAARSANTGISNQAVIRRK